MATIALDGASNGIIRYIGEYTMYTPKNMICYFHPVKTDRVGVNCGSHYQEWVFDDEAQRNAAIATLLSWF